MKLLKFPDAAIDIAQGYLEYYENNEEQDELANSYS